MAYITKEQVAEIRNELEKEFPAKNGWKFSVTIQHYSTVSVAVLQAPVKLIDKGYQQINHYSLDRRENAKELKKITEICMRGNFDKSDSMTDYFHVGWYFNLSVGKWNKPFICKA